MEAVFGAVLGEGVMRHLSEGSFVVADFFHNFDGVLLNAESLWYGGADRNQTWRRVATRRQV